MARRSQTTATKSKTLQAENKRLRSENDKLKKRLKTNPGLKHKTGSVWKKIVVLACTVIAGALLVAGNLLFWTAHTIVDTDKYVATVSPLIKQPAIQQAAALYTTQQLYKNVNVEQTIQGLLPPRADFLAPTLAGQIKQATQTTLQNLLASEKFQTVWTDSMTKTHEQIINFVRNYQGNGTINLNDVFQRLTTELKDTKLAFLAGKQLPPNIGSITVVEAKWLPRAHNLVTNLNLYQWLATLAFFAASFGAIWLSANRRRAVIRLGIIYGSLMFLFLMAIRVVQNTVANHVNPDYKQAASEAARIVTNPLIMQTRVLLLLGLLAAVIAWISGPYRSALATRRRVQNLFEGRLHQALFHKGENGLSRWVGRYQRSLQWISIAIVAIVMITVELTSTLVFWYALLMLSLVLLVELLAADNTRP